MTDHEADDDDLDPEDDEAVDEYEEDDLDEDDEGGLYSVTPDPRTICHLCGGAGFIANPVLGVIGGTPRTIDNGRECPHCLGAKTFPGMVIPV